MTMMLQIKFDLNFDVSAYIIISSLFLFKNFVSITPRYKILISQKTSEMKIKALVTKLFPDPWVLLTPQKSRFIPRHLVVKHAVGVKRGEDKSLIRSRASIHITESNPR